MMFDPNTHSFCNEFYAIEKTIEVVVTLKGSSDPSRIRIDALRDERSGDYSTMAYIEENVTLQPTYPQSSGKFVRPPQGQSIWVKYDLPWTRRSNADDALRQALDWLSQRCQP